MDSFKPIISVGFDKNGEADFRVSIGLLELPVERMNKLRAMIPVAIGQAEDYFRRYIERQNPPAEATQATRRLLETGSCMERK